MCDFKRDYMARNTGMSSSGFFRLRKLLFRSVRVRLIRNSATWTAALRLSTGFRCLLCAGFRLLGSGGLGFRALGFGGVCVGCGV